MVHFIHNGPGNSGDRATDAHFTVSRDDLDGLIAMLTEMREDWQ